MYKIWIFRKFCKVIYMTSQFKIFNISQVPFESIHDMPDSRQTLATQKDLTTKNIDALTKGTLRPGHIWDWHKHPEHDELGIVLAGEGKFYWQDEVVTYKKDDVIIIPVNTIHKFEATGNVTNEFYFVRIKV